MQSINKLLFLFLFLVSQQAFSQSVYPDKVIPLDSDLVVTEKLLSYLSPYKFILVGEQHGTQEPLKLVTQLAKALSKTKTVSVGFEIPADELNKKGSDLSHLKTTCFFKTCKDGRASEAYLEAIVRVSELKNCNVFFYDVTKLQQQLPGDSAMFLNIKNQYLKDTNRIILTISGNIHNQLQPYKKSKTMGYFLSSWYKGQILSVNHQYASGTVYNFVNNAYGLRTVTEDTPNGLKTISPTPDYFYPDPNCEFSEGWNAFLFTTKINASFPVKNE